MKGYNIPAVDSVPVSVLMEMYELFIIFISLSASPFQSPMGVD